MKCLFKKALIRFLMMLIILRRFELSTLSLELINLRRLSFLVRLRPEFLNTFANSIGNRLANILGRAISTDDLIYKTNSYADFLGNCGLGYSGS